MTTDLDVRQLLVNAEQPMSPSPEFDERLFEELFGGARPATDLPRGRGAGLHDRRPDDARANGWRWMVAAAAALIGLVVAVNAFDDGTRAVKVKVGGETPDRSPAGSREAAADDACDAFRSTAFSGMERTEIFSPNNADSIATAEAAGAMATTLRVAYEKLLSDLAMAGVDIAPFSQQSDRIIERMRRAEREALDVDLADALDELEMAEEQFIAVDRLLTEQGMGGCL